MSAPIRIIANNYNKNIRKVVLIFEVVGGNLVGKNISENLNHILTNTNLEMAKKIPIYFHDYSLPHSTIEKIFIDTIAITWIKLLGFRLLIGDVWEDATQNFLNIWIIGIFDKKVDILFHIKNLKVKLKTIWVAVINFREKNSNKISKKVGKKF